ncbi:ABC transporter ATP-binding protein [Roseiconus nitratireducens]|uniref:ABC transporter ATP-binding protein n=1 Tax=Roseiconus nitratireducens TaxID=2605748 RepID=A0A5M6DKV1_9BACT|nr:ABC transporter ATP-binding protein [Roseiconus nitratireducens]KAA5546892.1 ABC transporter ATP-binding protein [Roseiconus nitratireducens]
MNSIVSIENVSHSFGRQQALINVSLEIPKGQVFALLGENGAGKTTLIRVLTGLIRPDSGSATVLGLSCLRDGQAIRQRTGYVSDSPSMYEWMTADEIGWFTSAFYDDQFANRYSEALMGFEVPPNVKLKHLSKGQRAKVALALATAHDPELLILDEPTSGLDPMVRRQFLESMVDRAALGRSVLLSSHQINEVERVADWVGILHQGRLKLVQPLQALRDNTLVITATLEHGDATVVPPRGDVLSESRNGRQMRWVVREAADDWRSDYGEQSGVLSADARPASLEEVFVAVCETRPDSAWQSEAATQPTTGPLASA